MAFRMPGSSSYIFLCYGSLMPNDLHIQVYSTPFNNIIISHSLITQYSSSPNICRYHSSITQYLNIRRYLIYPHPRRQSLPANTLRYLSIVPPFKFFEPKQCPTLQFSLLRPLPETGILATTSYHMHWSIYHWHALCSLCISFWHVDLFISNEYGNISGLSVLLSDSETRSLEFFSFFGNLSKTGRPFKMLRF